MELQLSEMKSLVLLKEEAVQKKEQAFNEVLQVCARYSKNDKVFMTKLREVKMKLSERGNGEGEVPAL